MIKNNNKNEGATMEMTAKKTAAKKIARANHNQNNGEAMETTTKEKRSFLSMLIDGMKEVYLNVFKDVKSLFKSSKKSFHDRVVDVNTMYDYASASYVRNLENNLPNGNDYVRSDDLEYEVEEIMGGLYMASEDYVDEAIRSIDVQELINDDPKLFNNLQKFIRTEVKLRVKEVKEDLQSQESKPVKEIKNRMDKQIQLIQLLSTLNDNGETKINSSHKWLIDLAVESI